MTMLSVVEPLSLDQIKAAREAELRAALPGWSGEVTDPVYKSYVEQGGAREFARRELENAHALALDPRTAVGSDLDAIGARVLVFRVQGEADEPYRARILAGEGLRDIDSAGQLSFYTRQAVAFDSKVVSAGIEVDAAPARSFRLYILSNEAANGAPSQMLRTALEAYMEPRLFLDYTLTSPAPAITAYTVAATLTRTPDAASEADVEASARAAVYAYIAAQRAFGRNVRVSGITAALSVNGVESVNVTAPAADLVLASGDQHTVYYCPADATNVVLSFA